MISVVVSGDLLAAQWALLAALAVFVIIIYRQLAHLMKLGEASKGDGGIAVGDEASAFSYRPPVVTPSMQSGKRRFRFSPVGEPTVLLFADPGCGSCGAAMTLLENTKMKAEAAGIRLLAVTEADEAMVSAVDAFGKTTLPLALVEPGTAFRLYKTTVTPLALAIGPDGMVRGKQIVSNKASVKRLLTMLSDKHDASKTHAGSVNQDLKGGNSS